MNPFAKRRMIVGVFVALLGIAASARAADPLPLEEAWQRLPAYRYGDDMAPLLAIDRAVIECHAGGPQQRRALAARLASVLADPQTTPAARQYICLKLRDVGTPEQVPLLKEMLLVEETSEIARYAIEAIPGEESLAALRQGLEKLEGPARIGVIQSLGARRDGQAVAALRALADYRDDALAAAAVAALGRIANDEAVEYLLRRSEAGEPASLTLAAALLRAAEQFLREGKPQEAAAIFERLSSSRPPDSVRRAALSGLLDLAGDGARQRIIDGLLDGDAAQQIVAATRLGQLSDADLDAVAARLDKLPEAARRIVVGEMTARRGTEILPLVLELLKSDNPARQVEGLRLLPAAGDPSTVPLVVDLLAAGGEVTRAAQEALLALPRGEVGRALVAALRERPEIRGPCIETLVRMKYYEAIDPLIELAGSSDPAVYGPALKGLQGIADPDEHDIPRLVRLLLRTAAGAQRDEVERTILLVCAKSPAGADRAAPVHAALARIPEADPAAYLPLLGRLGGEASRKRIDAAMAGGESAHREAAVRALCNWPDASVADRLLKLAGDDADPRFRRWGLRAYIRVVSLPSDRPDAETLAMLQQAMKLARHVEDQSLVLERTASVRTMEAVLWLADYLDQPALAQAACRALVELAHHRFLRQPNIERFGPILRRVAETTDDPALAERAERYRLGL